MNDTQLPITGICLISKPTNVPTGYECLRKAYDDSNRDADLMADSLLERKDRFLCITRVWPLTDTRTLSNDRALVLEDIKLINERDTPPANYTALVYTSDTREKGTAKKTICVKMAERQAGMKCICDILFLYRSRRPPAFYTLTGEINGLQMCVKEGIVPVLRAPPPVPQVQSSLYPNPVTGTSPYIPQQQQHTYHHASDNSTMNTLTRTSDEREILDDIPFQINRKYLDGMNNNRNGNDMFVSDSFQILSNEQIEERFYYDFNIEKASL